MLVIRNPKHSKPSSSSRASTASTNLTPRSPTPSASSALSTDSKRSNAQAQTASRPSAWFWRPTSAPRSFEFAVERAVADGWEATLFGGLLFHGPYDGFGSGSAPTFAVSLTSTVGWSIHT
jgi:hypothetical protein